MSKRYILKNLFPLVKQKNPRKKFNKFVKDNDVSVIDLIQNVKNVNNENLLMYAIKYCGDMDFLQYLLDLGYPLLNNKWDMTSIDICVAFNKSENKMVILEWLHDNVIQFNPFYLNIYPRKIIKWLKTKEWNVNFNEKNAVGNTPLHEVCKKYHPQQPFFFYKNKNFISNYDAFHYLIENGADPTIKNRLGETVIDFCTLYSLINNLQILKNLNYISALVSHFNPLRINVIALPKKVIRWLIDNHDDLKLFDIHRFNLLSIYDENDMKITKYYDEYYNSEFYELEYNTIL